MHKWNQFVADYLPFTKKGRLGLLLIVCLTILIGLLPILFSSNSAVAIKADEELIVAIDSLELKKKKRTINDDEPDFVSSFSQRTTSTFSEGELFAFDPNTLSPDGWLRLGLNVKTIKTVSNYLKKGGHFYKREDILKIWGMPEDFYNRIKEYIIIERSEAQFITTTYTASNSEKKNFKKKPINVNEADTTTLILLPGIGSKLATRILNFREKLGGFYSIDQIAETYGLPDSTFQKIKPLLVIEGGVKKLDINIATKDELKIHPYIKWNLANVLVEYRLQHGPYKSLPEIKNITLIDDGVYSKISPYLTVE